VPRLIGDEPATRTARLFLRLLRLQCANALFRLPGQVVVRITAHELLVELERLVAILQVFIVDAGVGIQRLYRFVVVGIGINNVLVDVDRQLPVADRVARQFFRL
jgi:hypothetical protein